MNMQEKVRLMGLMKHPIEKLSPEELEYAKSINVICERQKRICFGQGRECEKCDMTEGHIQPKKHDQKGKKAEIGI